jgi:hypothetical protein
VILSIFDCFRPIRVMRTWILSPYIFCTFVFHFVFPSKLPLYRTQPVIIQRRVHPKVRHTFICPLAHDIFTRTKYQSVNTEIWVLAYGHVPHWSYVLELWPLTTLFEQSTIHFVVYYTIWARNITIVVIIT